MSKGDGRNGSLSRCRGIARRRSAGDRRGREGKARRLRGQRRDRSRSRPHPLLCDFALSNHQPMLSPRLFRPLLVALQLRRHHPRRLSLRLFLRPSPRLQSPSQHSLQVHPTVPPSHLAVGRRCERTWASEEVRWQDQFLKERFVVLFRRLIAEG
jgi:hypothetical protein